ncbi:ubiquitin-protein transferase [Aureococcus anophagefferens]|nr:ubiquitin-protein transferase [Aureococcus anophagefferens]
MGAYLSRAGAPEEGPNAPPSDAPPSDAPPAADGAADEGAAPPAADAAADEGAAPDAAADAAPDAEAKRARPARDAFAGVLENEGNVTAILGFSGYRSVLVLEALNRRARRVVRGANVQLDVSREADLTVAVRTAARAELLAAGAGAADRDQIIFFSTRQEQKPIDVVCRGGSTLLLSPPPPASVDGFRGADADATRSTLAAAAGVRHRKALLSLGHVSVELGPEGGSAQLRSQIRNLQKITHPASAAAPEDAKKLVDAMGGELAVPRRVALAAGRRPVHPQRRNGARSDLDAAMRRAASLSAVLDEATMQRIVVFAWKAISHHGWGFLSEAVFLEEVCGPAGAVGAKGAADVAMTDAHVGRRDRGAGGGDPMFGPPGTRARGFGDVRTGDVAALGVFNWLWPAVTGYALTSLARDAATCFSNSHFIAATTFERFVVYQNDASFDNDLGIWSVALAVLKDLMSRRDGEATSEPGRRRGSEAIRSLLQPDRFRALAAGDAVDFETQGNPEMLRSFELSWVRGSVVSLTDEKAVVRFGDTTEVDIYLGRLRLVEEKPSPAIVLLAHAIGDHRNDIVREILASPLMSSPCSYTVGDPGQTHMLMPGFPVSTPTENRATVLDHAIAAKNSVGIGLLSAKYLDKTATCDGNAWRAVRSSCPYLAYMDAASTSPAERSDLHCALRQNPYPFIGATNAWLYPHWMREKMDPLSIAAADGNLAACRAYLSKNFGKTARACMLSLPIIPSFWRSDATEVMSKYRGVMGMALSYASKMGREEVVSEILCRMTVGGVMQCNPIDHGTAVLIAVAEGHLRCLERLLMPGPLLENFLARFRPGAPVDDLILGMRALRQAIDLGDGAAIEILASRGVPLVGTDEGVLNGAFSDHLSFACSTGQPESVRALLRNPAVAQAVREGGTNAFHAAACRGRASTLAALLESFSLAHAKEDAPYFDPPIVLAANIDDIDTVEVLVAQPDINRPRECTPMFLKYVKRHWLLEGEVAAFVEHDSAVVNQRDDAGLTPLHVFVFNAMSNFGEDALNAESADFLFKTTIKITKLLIFNGADATSKTTGTADAFPIGAGLSPIDVARTCGQDEARRAQLIAALGGSTEPTVAIAALGGSAAPAVASMDPSSDERLAHRATRTKPSPEARDVHRSTTTADASVDRAVAGPAGSAPTRPPTTPRSAPALLL